ncbi:hypothetical protein DM819_15280 [Pseudomonas hunanensis]|uniref:Uncharacterized protein n=2 Tax=Pseudomonas hunanensis TaxID=1247546 RepID=A0ABD6N098_9PSED|nr:hypothetical protein [Pseudomonas hunanensis]
MSNGVAPCNAVRPVRRALLSKFQEHLMTKVIVTFDKNWRGYAAGETAGFESNVAEGLIVAGYASEAGKQAKKGKPNNGSAAAPGKDNGGDATGAAGKSDDSADSDGKP